MADDMVAELTLRIINEMNGGIDQVKGELQGVQDVAASLTTQTGELSAVLSELNAPAALQTEMQALETSLTESATALGDMKADLTGMPAEIEAANTAALTFGTTIVDDTTKIKAMIDEMGQAPSLALAGGGGGFGGGGGGGGASGEGDGDEKPPPPGELPDDPEQPRRPGGGNPVGELDPEKHSGGLGNWIMEGLALFSGYEGEKQYAAFQNIAISTAQIEGFHGADALTEAQKIMEESYNQAYLSRGKVDDIEQAYFNLIRQGIPKPIVNSMMGPLSEAATTYSTPIEDLTNPLYNLFDQFKLPADQMSQGVAILGAASHLGHFYFSDFAHGLPQVGNQFAAMGDTGLKGEANAAAALEIVRRGTPDAGTASTDLQDLMTYMTSPMAVRFFDRSQRSKDLLGPNIMSLYDKYHIEPLDIPQYFDAEQAKGIDPLNAMVDYMHTIGAGKMTATDEMIVFNSLFHNQEASTAMRTLVGNYGDYRKDQTALNQIGPGFLDENFMTAIQGDSGGMSQLDELGTYYYRMLGQNTWGLLANTSGAPSQATANATSPGSSAFNIPISLTVNVDKSGNATATAAPAFSPSADDGLTKQYLPPPGVNLKVNQGNVLSQP